MSRLRSWTWTMFPHKKMVTMDALKKSFETKTEYTCFGEETCPKTGKKHLQGFTYLKNGKTLAAFKKQFDKTMHCEPSKGSAEENRAYCFKGDQSKEEWEDMKTIGPHYGLNAITWECGTMPQQGTRNDIIELRNACVKATCLSDIIADDANVTALAKYGKFAERVHTAALKKRTRDFRHVEVIVHWGKTGTGKTRLPYGEGAFKWNPEGNEWWDGYDGEEVLLIDEFYGQIKPSRLLTILDGYQCRLPIKGGFTYAQWTKVYITCNVPPQDWYSNVPEEVRLAIERRISHVREFK